MTTYKYNLDGSQENTAREERYSTSEMKADSKKGYHIHSVVKVMNNKVGIGVVVKYIDGKNKDILFSDQISRYIRDGFKKNNAIIYGLWIGVQYIEEETSVDDRVYFHYPESESTVKNQIRNGDIPKWVKEKTVDGYTGSGRVHIWEFSNGGQKASVLARKAYDNAYGGNVPDWNDEKTVFDCKP